MIKISKSHQRYAFQKQAYVKRQTENGHPIDKDYLYYLEKIIKDNDSKWENPMTREYNLEWDLITTDWILDKVRKNEIYAQNLYAAMCNNSFIKIEVMPILKGQEWSCSWRYAGGIIADMKQSGDYIDWYCSGIRDKDNTEQDQYVGEGCITEEIHLDLKRLGWMAAPGGDWENLI